MSSTSIDKKGLNKLFKEIFEEGKAVSEEVEKRAREAILFGWAFETVEKKGRFVWVRKKVRI